MTAYFQALTDLENTTESMIRTCDGGKALGLWQMHKLSLSIPKTWVIDASLFKQFIKVNQSVEFDSKVAEQFISGHIGKELSDLSAGEYAIRSSATQEDSQEHSFAGIFASELHINKTELANAITKVWQSAFNARAKDYSSDQPTTQMAVVIQPMLQAKLSGVAFSIHPSPNTVFENNTLLIEYAECEGEKLVQGEITPQRLIGSVEQIKTSHTEPWLLELTNAMTLLKTKLHHEVDIEFLVDKSGKLTLLQQRPVSVAQQSKSLNLSAYQRAYKRALSALDVELLITGCAKHLADYLEVPFALSEWMVMVSNKGGTQELWLHEKLNQSVIENIVEKIKTDKDYLAKIQARYRDYYQRIITTDYSQFNNKTSLLDRFQQWLAFILPIQAHYYAPMFIIDVLSELLLTHMKTIDADAALADFQKLATHDVRSLVDCLQKELRGLKVLSADSYQAKLGQIVEEYSFLKCHQMYETGYSKADFITMANQLDDSAKPADSVSVDAIIKKYIQGKTEQKWLKALNTWLNIRNQEMEYLMYAVLKSRPLFEGLATKMKLSVKDVWSLNTASIVDHFENNTSDLKKARQTDKTAIYYHDGKAHVRDDINVLYPIAQSSKKQLHGKTVHGQGKLTAKIKKAFSPAALDGFSANGENYILVTGMTTPDFIPYLKENFIGLVTDEGGVLCHAAIIAREIPMNAIVGTGLATEILSDDMVVTIDFDRELVLLN